jgi:hypothetical protein
VQDAHHSTMRAALAIILLLLFYYYYYSIVIILFYSIWLDSQRPIIVNALLFKLATALVDDVLPGLEYADVALRRVCVTSQSTSRKPMGLSKERITEQHRVLL